MSLLSHTLEAFWAVVQKGTVQEASSILGITQTGVTQRIRTLEKSVGTTLFIRSRKGMRLTQEGESLLQYVKLSIENEGLVLSQIKGDRNAQNIRVTISGPSSLLRARLIPNVLKTPPKGITFKFNLADGSENHEKLKNGFCDIAILEHHQVTKEMDSKILKPERYKIYVTKQWRKRSLLEVVSQESIIDFDEKDTMTFSYLEKYKLKAKIKNHRHYANNTDALLSLIKSGLGYSVLSEEFVKICSDSGDLYDIAPDQFYDYKIALAWYYRSEMPKYFRSILDSID